MLRLYQRSNFVRVLLSCWLAHFDVVDIFGSVTSLTRPHLAVIQDLCQNQHPSWREQFSEEYVVARHETFGRTITETDIVVHAGHWGAIISTM